MTSLEYYIEQIEQFISMLTDDIKSGEGTVVTQTKLTVYREVLEHLEEIEQEPKFIAKADGTIEQAKNCDDCLFKKEWEKIGKLLSVVLKKQTEREPCENAISRTEVIKSIDEREDVNGKVDAESVRTDIVLMPPVTPQPKTGHWIMPVQDDGMSEPIYYQVRCSECGFDLDPQTWHMELHQYDADKYCPKCGTPMIEPQESEG